MNIFRLDISALDISLDVGFFKEYLLPIPHISYFGFHPADGFRGSHKDGSHLFDGVKVLLGVHTSPSPFFILYRVLSLGLTFLFRNLLKVPGQQPKYTAALSNGMSFSFKKPLSSFLISSMSFTITYKSPEMACQVFFYLFYFFYQLK